MLYKKSNIVLFIFLILQITILSLLYCPTVTSQTQSPFLLQPTLPFTLGTSFLPFPQIGNTLAFNTLDNIFYPPNLLGTGPFGVGILPIINQRLTINPYMPAATYYAAALLPADVLGAWSGTWTSTSILINLSSDINLTLVQATNDVAGTLLFLTAGIVKLGCPVVGVIDVDLLTIMGNGLLAGKTPVPYEIVLTAGVAGAVMEGEYIITETLLGNVIEQGTFTATKL